MLNALVERAMQRARDLSAKRQALGHTSVKLYDTSTMRHAHGTSHCESYSKLEAMTLNDNPCFVVTYMNLPDPQTVYADLYYARGQAKNFIKQFKCDLAADRTSYTTFLANCMRFDPPLRGLCLAPTIPSAYRTDSCPAHDRHSQNVQGRYPGQINTSIARYCTCRQPIRSASAPHHDRTHVSGQNNCRQFLQLPTRRQARRQFAHTLHPVTVHMPA